MTSQKELTPVLKGQPLADAVASLQDACHTASINGGWWTCPETGEYLGDTDGTGMKRNTGQLLMLCVSELAEAMEGDRKDLMDDHLPHRKMMEVELADAVIRICDLAGGKGYDLGGAIAEKLAYNAQRADHKMENRVKDGGKKY